MKKLLLLTVCMLLLAACKPTEKNYRNAYEKAIAKKKEIADMDSIDIDEIISVDGARRQQVGDDYVWILPEIVKPMKDDKSGGEGSMAVVVGKFSMSTNADRQAADLSATEPDAIVCINGKGIYYVSVQRCNSLQEAADYISDFQSRHPGYSYIGLNNKPMVVSIR